VLWLNSAATAKHVSFSRLEEETVKHLVSWIAVVAFALGVSSSARAQTRLTLLTPDPIREEIRKLVEQYEAKTHNTVQMSYGTGVGTRRTVAEGGALDVTLLFAPFDEALKTGNVDKESQTVVARLRLAIAVKKGAPKPDISTAAAAKQTLLNAKSIISVDPAQGSVGGAALLALQKMGIADQVKSKIKWVPGGGEVQTSVANGETEIALGPYLSDMRNPGLDIVGALPPEAATPVDITGWIATNALDPKAARALLDYLKSKEAAPVWEAAKAFPVQ
jgi:molybdate transport system substrate-binding protein